MTIKTIDRIRRNFVDDPGRPRFHYLPPANWMNDPNGLIQWDGQYHLFYQYNPNAAVHTNMHWGHAVSDDLIHWKDLPIAIAPTPNSADEGGIYSGCIIDNDGVPTAFYTGVNQGDTIQTQCMATSRDGLLTWQKYQRNPVIAAPPAEMKQTSDFRDPYLWREDDAWMMAVGSRIKDIGGAVLLYRSQNLIDWEYLNPLLTGEIQKNGTMWECPNFFKLGDKWVLIISSHLGNATGTVIYFVGDYKDYRFIPEYEGILDHAYLYAPLTLLDDNGRRLLWGWIREGRSVEAHAKAGWAGAQSIPRILSLDAYNRLNMQPANELEAIRGKRHYHENLTLAEDRSIEFHGLTLALDILADVEIEQGGTITLSVACSTDGTQGTHISFDAETQELHIDREQASTSPADDRYPHRAIHELDEGETLQLRILLDGSVLEVIANNRTSITSRIYPTQATDDGIRLKGKKTVVHTLDIYEMRSIW